MAVDGKEEKGPIKKDFIPKIPPTPSSVGAAAVKPPTPPAPARRVFDEAVKQAAVARVVDGGETLQSVADDIGVHVNVLRGWRQKGEGAGTTFDTGALGSVEALQRENALLKAEIEYLKKRELILRR